MAKKRILVAEDEIIIDRQLRENDWELRAILEAAPNAVVITDSDGCIVFFNAQAEEMFGYDRKELLGQPVEILLPERFRQAHRAHQVGYLTAPRTRPMGTGLDLCGFRKDGTEFPAEIALSAVEAQEGVLVISFVSDITVRKHVEEEIRKLSRAVEQSPSTVVITDMQGNIEYVNPKFSQITGYAAEEVIGQNPRILRSGEQSTEYYQELWDTILAGDEWRGEFSNKKKNGELYWEFASISPIRDAQGAITHFLKVAEDITDRKRAEEALRRRTVELQARNAELDAFAHTVAHDLKNPLNLVIGFAEILKSDHDTMSPEDLEKYLQTIARGSRKVGNIVDELLLLATVRRADITVGSLNMADVMTEAQRRLVDMVEEYQAEIVKPTIWPAALGHGPWVEAVWANYLSNAIKYGGRPPQVEVGAAVQADGMVRFWVRDNGPGLSPEEQAKLFVPFMRLDQIRAQGHGLGLSIVRMIVEKLGGRVGVESEGVPGRGSVFSFTLPAIADGA